MVVENVMWKWEGIIVTLMSQLICNTFFNIMVHYIIY